MNKLVRKRLGGCSADELDGYIVDAYLSLELAMRGELYTNDGAVVVPNMGQWGRYTDEECHACLAGAFFVGKVSESLYCADTFVDSYYSKLDMTLLSFLDGLRFIHTDLFTYRESLQLILEELGYEVSYSDQQEINVLKEKENGANIEDNPALVLYYLRQFIKDNPRLNERLPSVNQ